MKSTNTIKDSQLKKHSTVVDVFVKDEFTGEYKIEYKAVNLEASFQKIYQLTGKKKICGL